MALMVKNHPANAGDARDVGLIPGLGRSPGGGHGNTLACSCLENPMDRGAWWATVHGVAKSQTQLKRLSMHAHIEFTVIVLHDRLPHQTELCRAGIISYYTPSPVLTEAPAQNHTH